MSHNTFSRPIPMWGSSSNNVAVVNARDWQIWDTWQYQGIDGDNGGTWTPTKPIVIGGAGLLLSGAGNSIVGGITTSTGGRLIHGDSDYVTFSASRQRVMSVSFLGMQAFNVAGGKLAPTMQDSPFFGMALQPGSWSKFVLPIPSRYMHQGSYLSKVIATGRMLSQPSALPSTPMRAIFQNSSGSGGFGGGLLAASPGSIWQPSFAYSVGDYVYPLAHITGFYYRCISPGTTAAFESAWPTTIGDPLIDGGVTWECEGYGGLSPYPTTPAGYYAGGQVQQFTLSSDTYNTFPVDCSSNTYALTIVSDNAVLPGTSETGTGWIWHTLRLYFNSIGDMRPE